MVSDGSKECSEESFPGTKHEDSEAGTNRAHVRIGKASVPEVK